MIDKLIEKYNKKLKYITDLKNKTSFELVRVSCLEKEFIVKEIIKDLEEVIEKVMYPKDFYIDNDNHSYASVDEIIGVDTDE